MTPEELRRLLSNGTIAKVDENTFKLMNQSPVMIPHDSRHKEIYDKVSNSFEKWKKGQAYEEEKGKFDDAFAKCKASISEGYQLVNELQNAGLIIKKG